MTNAVKTTHTAQTGNSSFPPNDRCRSPPLLCVLLVLILPMAGTLPRIVPTDKEGGVFNNCSRAMNVACPGCCGLEEDDTCSSSSSSGPLNCIFNSIDLNTCVVTTLLSGSVLCFRCFFWFFLFFFSFLPGNGGR